MVSADIHWSYSSLKQYINCPKNYYETRVAKNYATKDTKYTIYGKEIHSAIENYIINKTPFPKNYKKVLSAVPGILGSLPIDKYVEYKMALNILKAPCRFDDPDYWVRGIADLIAIDGETAFVIDWKTGSSQYADTKQLRLMALLIFAHFDKVQEVRSMLYFTKDNFPILDQTRHRETHESLWTEFSPDLFMLDQSFTHNNWPMKPSGLCGYCPVSSCPHYDPRN